MSTSKYEYLHQFGRETRLLEGIDSLLSWDQETYMPRGASTIRSEQRAMLAGLVHQRRTSTEFRDALNQLIDLKTGEVKATSLSSKQQAALREWLRDDRQATALPNAFVRELAEVTSSGVVVWREARQENDFDRFCPHLEKIVEMNRRKADFLGYQEHPYDALLDLYEPGITTAQLDELFTELKAGIVSLLEQIVKAPQVDASLLNGQFPKEQQLALALDLMDAIGYSQKHGRLDESAHPFSSASHPSDSRITTRFNTKNVLSSLLCVLHESGHSFYEMGLPSKEYGTPLGDAASHGIHESQSRFWETRIGQSESFWHFFLPRLQKHFPNDFKHASAEQVYRAVNQIKPSLIRVEADEVTYGLHVILRFELEKKLLEGSLQVRDLPQAWNAQMQSLLSLCPSTNANGCLQDIHWSMGAFGYFPSYTLGNVYAAQLFETFAETYPDWSDKVQKGKFTFIRDWLNENIYQHGRRYTGPELLNVCTGKPLSVSPYLEYLNKKYSNVYALKQPASTQSAPTQA